jgi:hypothetical protein
VFQFLLSLGWAVTVHKSQGQTLDRLAINIRYDAFAHGAFYTALSRVRNLIDIMLFGLAVWLQNGIHLHVNEFIRFAQVELRDVSMNPGRIERFESESRGDSIQTHINEQTSHAIEI